MAGVDWTKTTLGKITKWTSGGTPRKNNPAYWNGDIPWISAVSMKKINLHDSKFKITQLGLVNGSRLAEPKSILLLVRGSELHNRIPIGIAIKPVAFNQDVKAITTNGDILPEYLLYWLLGNEPAILSKVESTGIGAGKLDIEILKNLPINLPPISEQHAIAYVLGILDDKIELNRRMNETLEAIARALFKSWFVDFDPVHAKAEGRPTGLPQDIEKLFPETFEESIMGSIPKGWIIGIINDIGDINIWTLSKKDILTNIDYIEISEVNKGDIGNIIHYRRGTEPSRARRRLQHGDTVLSTVRPDRGAYFLCLNPPTSLIASTGFATITPKYDRWAFVYTMATQSEICITLGHLADGGAYPAVRPEIIGTMQIVIPDEKIQIAFEKHVQPLYLMIENNRRNTNTLRAIRDTLLPQLISGNIRVSIQETLYGE